MWHLKALNVLTHLIQLSYEVGATIIQSRDQCMISHMISA